MRVKSLLSDLGCDPDKTHFDIPKMRSSTSDNYLAAGIACAWHPHRDPWYSAPPQQINWWISVYDITSGNAMAFHPAYWNRKVKNDSAGYNYYEANKFYRGAVITQYLKSDPRPLPKLTEPLELDPSIRLICPARGVILFSGAQLHSSVPNTSGKTRFSIDFRVVSVDDVTAKRGALVVDEDCTGTTLRDFLRVPDLARIPDEFVALYEDGSIDKGEATYRPDDLQDSQPKLESHRG